MPAGVSAFVPLANITLGSAAASVTFSSIVGIYRDLFLIAQCGVTSGPTTFRVIINSDSGTNYNIVGMRGAAATVANGYSAVNMTSLFASYNDNVSSTNTFSAQVNFLDYSATDKHKTVIAHVGNAGTALETNSLRWANTAAITSLQVLPGGSTFLAGSTFSLYGVSSV